MPPVAYGDHLYQLADNGTVRSVSETSGHVAWTRTVGALSASSPALGRGAIYLTLLESHHGRSAGRIVALTLRTGQVRWSRNLPSGSESSPLYYHQRVYFGTANGTVYSLDARDGHIEWTYQAAGAVKASPTLYDGRLIFGDYAGDVTALWAKDGHRDWRTAPDGSLLGNGTYYSTAAAHYGRVFLGNTDGRIDALDAFNGHLDWARQTGSYVYSSPAVTSAPGLGPTVYVGSYDGALYALDAHDGAIRWEYHTPRGGKISGGITIIGRIAYFADLGHDETFGVGISVGHTHFRMHQGAFDPVVSNGVDLFLSGYGGLFALAPRHD
jgi:outer membrane protein assembly factor BamB